ncbi:cytochrome P450 [Bradyrhizobium sp. i1.3.1]
MSFDSCRFLIAKRTFKKVLRTFEQQLSREAKSKLTLDAFVPPPSDIDNERYEPLFDKYIITGKTYTTASGAVVPNELQYYNGQMVHLYGECSNVPLVNAALAGSGYRPIILKYADGRHAAVAQLWSNKFTDTSIRPYAAMFIVVAAVADNAPESHASLRAASNGSSSVLVMLDGSFDPAMAVYENEARMYMFRLLDTTQVAIDVGRERMGTDKRPGTIDMACIGRRLHLSIKDQHRRGVVQGDLALTGDPTAYESVVAQAAKTAGVTLQALPRGAECVYPAVARIGQGSVVCWQWRSDVAPRLQPVMPGSLHFDRSSEEGRTLLAWGFTPKVLGFFPKVRGVITGLADQTPRCARDSSAACEGMANAGSRLRWGASEEAASAPFRLAWNTSFLGSLKVVLRKELVGPMSDGLRVNWHITEGTFVGPGHDAVVLPGAADWMHIRPDGIAIVNVRACFETRDRVRVYGAYGGVADFGPDGYARALRGEYDQQISAVVTPTYETADPRLEWLNRVQCIGVGKVDMSALRAQFDMYVVRVGERAQEASSAAAQSPIPEQIITAVERFRAAIPANFDPIYVEKVVIPFFLTNVYEGERPLLPMIDLNFSKENALPRDRFGLIYRDWKPTPEEGVMVFLQGLEKRGQNNLRKRIYFSAVTPDLYKPMYRAKVTAFFDKLLDQKFADRPFMQHYLDHYFDLYWDLHLGLVGSDIPREVREIGEAFNTVFAYRDPLLPVTYQNYMKVRELQDFLKSWIGKRIDDIQSGKIKNPERTMAWHWLKNAQDGGHFSKKDMVIECLHDFVALSQWGNAIFRVMSLLSEDRGDQAVRASFQKTMSGNFDTAGGASFSPLELFVMELFRVISPNGGSVSAIHDARLSVRGEAPQQKLGMPFERDSYVSTPHASTSLDPVHWTDPNTFDPQRYLRVPTSAQINDDKCRQIGLARCPFDITNFKVKDGRNAHITNSGFGTLFVVADERSYPVCDYAGFAPFGFGYRRCAGEQLTILVFEDFLRKVWRDKIVFRKLDLANLARVPVGLDAVIQDDIGFYRSALR